MIQAVMLITLGFLVASLIGVLVAPALWGRAYRLSRKRLEKALPLSLSEIEATQDQLRAAHAVKLRRLETALASAKQKAALQLVDNSRLQMQIAALKDSIADLELKLSERRNAATVLEQTITRRFPELEREVASLKADLQERSRELQDLLNKLARKDESLEAAQRGAAAHQEELTRLREGLEKTGADKSGRRLRRPSQWNLEDYRAEYDRLNLELSKLRQQLGQLQERESNQAALIKGELQKLAELMLASGQTKAEASAAGRLEAAPVKRVTGPDLRRDRPVPWPQSAPPLRKTQDGSAGEPAAPAPLSLNPPPSPPAAPAPKLVEEKGLKSGLNKAELAYASGNAAAVAAKTSILHEVTSKAAPETPALKPVAKGVLSKADEKSRPEENESPSVEVKQNAATANVAAAGKTGESARPANAREIPGDASQAISLEPAVKANNAPPPPAQEAGAALNGAPSGEEGRGSAISAASLRSDEERAASPNKALADARELKALSELMAMVPASGTEKQGQAGSGSTSIAEEAKLGMIIDMEPLKEGVAEKEADARQGQGANRTLLDRLRGVAEETAEANE